MTYTRVSKLIPPSLYPLKAPYAMTPQYITIHNTYNDVSALNEIAYMTRNTSATSYHVAIDDIHAVEAIPFNRNGWHSGDGLNGNGNRKSIGIEICYSKSGGAKYALAEANAIEYTAHLLKQYGWSIANVKWHRDWSGKNCPHRILDEGRASAVRNAIARRLAELNSPTVTPVSNPVAPKEETELYEKAIVINSFIDYPAVEKLHVRTGYPIFQRNSLKAKVAKELLVAGGGTEGLAQYADVLTDLSGVDREQTGANVKAYMNAL